MKVILSRKGWDSTAGGYASPIFPGGEMLSLPIPENGGSVASYSSILTPRLLGSYGISNIGAFLSLYRSPGPIGSLAHLDPDLDPAAAVRSRGWRPAFGQCSGAASHLDAPNRSPDRGVRAGDLFLFYGWFEHMSKNAAGKWISDGQRMYVIWGWLQVAQIWRSPASEWPAWLHSHPHYVHASTYPASNRVYEATSALNIEGVPARVGGGVFDFHPNRVLAVTPGFRGTFPDIVRAKAGSFVFSKFRQEHVLLEYDETDLNVWLRKIFV